MSTILFPLKSRECITYARTTAKEHEGGFLRKAQNKYGVWWRNASRSILVKWGRRCRSQLRSSPSSLNLETPTTAGWAGKGQPYRAARAAEPFSSKKTFVHRPGRVFSCAHTKTNFGIVGLQASVVFCRDLFPQASRLLRNVKSRAFAASAAETSLEHLLRRSSFALKFEMCGCSAGEIAYGKKVVRKC